MCSRSTTTPAFRCGIVVSMRRSPRQLLCAQVESPAPPVVFDLFERVMARVRPKAVTLEYNWSPQFPESTLMKHVDRVHEIVRN